MENLFYRYQCTCKEGWGGPNCEMRPGSCLNDDPCGGRGACDSNSLYPGYYQCICNPGRENDVAGLAAGLYCNKTIDLCINNPCRNDGTCLLLGMQIFLFQNVQQVSTPYSHVRIKWLLRIYEFLTQVKAQVTTTYM